MPERHPSSYIRVNNMNKTAISMILALGLPTAAIADNYPAYWVGSDGDYVRSGFGYCVRTINWTPEKAIAGCEGGEMTKAAAAPAPAESEMKKADEDAMSKQEAAAPAAAPAPAPAPVAAAEPAEKAEPQFRNLSLSSGATFELGGSQLSAEGKAAVATILRQFDGEEIRAVRVEGHTDDRGAAAFNQQLSEKRAAAVVDELVANGVDASVIEMEGFGESRPIADNNTREGRAKNRRVDIKVDARTRQF